MPFLGRTPTQLVDPEVDINGGAIDGVTIGATSASAGTFTNLTATGTLTLPDDGISGDDVNGGTISNFASTGIDDNATSTAITIASGGDVTVDGTDASTSIASPAILNLKAGDANNEYSTLRFATSADGSIAYVGAKATTTGAYPNSIGNLQFGVQNGGSTVTAMTINSSGNVGIGITVPTSQLHLSKAGGTTIKLGTSLNTSEIEARESGSANLLVLSANNSADHLVIDGGGRVGIGTTSASGKLDVTGSVGTVRVETTGNKISLTRNGANYISAAGGVSASISYEAPVHYFNSGDGLTTRLIINDSGNVGIGVSSPSTNNGTLVVGGINTTNNNAQGSIAFTDGGNNGQTRIRSYRGANYQKGELAFEVAQGTVNSYVEAMRIDSSGNVGIGTSSPSAQVHISGTAPAIRFQDTAGGDVWDIENLGGALTWDYGNSEKMRINSSGRVGIGTTSPQHLLHLVGSGATARIANTGVGNAGLIISYNNNTTHGLHLTYTPSNATAYIDNTYQVTSGTVYGDIYFRQNVAGTMTTRMMIDADGGNVSVTNTLSSAKLNSTATTGYLQIQGTDYYNWDTLQFYPVTDNARDLGDGSYRWKDLYLSGGAYLGGTGAANHLDDYEEGTYTPTYTGSSAAGSTTYTQNTGVYTKIGRTVTVWVDMTISAMSGASGIPYISLPFTSGTGYGTDPAGTTRYDMGGFISWQTADSFTGTRRPTGWITNNSNVMQMYGYTTAGTGSINAWTLNTTGRISGKIIYTAAF